MRLILLMSDNEQFNCHNSVPFSVFELKDGVVRTAKVCRPDRCEQQRWLSKRT